MAESKKEKSIANKDLILIGAIAVIVAVLVITIVLLYPSAQPPEEDTTSPQSPAGVPISMEELVGKMSKATESLSTETMDFEGSMEMEMSGGSYDALGGGSLTFDIDGNAEFDYANKKSRIIMNIDSPFLSFYGGGEQEMTIYLIDSVIYVLSQSPSTEDQWIRMEMEGDIWSETQINSQMTEVFEFVEGRAIGDEVINGKSTYIVEITPDIRKIMEYIMDFQLVGYPSSDLDEQIELIEDSIKSLSLRMWVGTDDSLLYKIDLSMDMEFVDESTSGYEKVTFSADLVAEFDHNVPVDIQLPTAAENAIDMSDLLESFLLQE